MTKKVPIKNIGKKAPRVHLFEEASLTPMADVKPDPTPVLQSKAAENRIWEACLIA